ncbi:DUF5675 family protein [Bacteroides sp. AN502(2024)]|uniref:DUF5675 family protein n=1 Tax=Bacteroides sp. AN502(2024) TaxID=3160599 RepID=UPI003514F083
MRKVTRKSLDELAKVMPIISEENQKMYVGGTAGYTGSTGYTGTTGVDNITGWVGPYDGDNTGYAGGNYGDNIGGAGPTGSYGTTGSYNGQECTMTSGVRVVVNLNRTDFGNDSTLGHYMATAYDAAGCVVGQITGVMLEPGRDYDRETVAGSDTAIPSGTYNVVPSTYHGQSGYYQVEGVSGRSAILIHPGNTGNDTLGCLLPGTTGVTGVGDPTVSNSRSACSELFDFFERNGSSGVTINIYG